MMLWFACALLAADTTVHSVAEARAGSFAHAGAQVTTQRSAGDVDAGARVELDAFAARSDAGVAPSSARLERLWVAFPVGILALTLGDVHAQLGRGLALSLRPEAGVGLDVALRGAQARLHAGDLEILALAGLANPANLDPLTLAPLSDPNDAIAGAEAAVRGRGVTVGVVGSAVLPRERLVAFEQDAAVTGGAFVDVTALDGALGFMLEADAQGRRLAGSLAPGAAVSSSARADLGPADAPVSIVVDALWLAGFEVKGSRNDALGIRFDYGRPPSLERTDVQSVPSGDLVGVRATALLPWGLEASAMGSIDRPDTPAARHVLDADAIARVDAGPAHAALGVGARSETAKALARRMVRAEGEGAIEVGHGFALTSAAKAQLWDDHVIGSALLGAQKSGASIGVEGGLDTEHKAAGDSVWFLAAIVALDVGPMTLRAVGGSQRGGFRCAGGVCREVPDFNGLKLELDARF